MHWAWAYVNPPLTSFLDLLEKLARIPVRADTGADLALPLMGKSVSSDY